MYPRRCFRGRQLGRNDWEPGAGGTRDLHPHGDSVDGECKGAGGKRHVIRSTARARAFFTKHSTISNTESLPEADYHHYYDVIMGAIASQITSLTIIYSAVYSDADQSKHQSSTSLAFVRGIHR